MAEMRDRDLMMVRLRDLPKPGERWRYGTELVMVDSLSCSRWRNDGEWIVDFQHIRPDGTPDHEHEAFRVNCGFRTSRLARFLHKAKKLPAD